MALIASHLPFSSRWPDCSSETTGTIYVHEQRAQGWSRGNGNKCVIQYNSWHFLLVPAILFRFDPIQSCGSVHIFSTETQKLPKTAIRIRVIGPFAAVLWQHDCPLRSPHRPRWRPPCSFNVLRLLFGDFIIDPKNPSLFGLEKPWCLLSSCCAYVSELASEKKCCASYEILPKCLGNQLIMEHPEIFEISR